jgi:hypothetical protein
MITLKQSATGAQEPSGARMGNTVYETLSRKIVPGLVEATSRKSKSPIKRWTGIDHLSQGACIIFGNRYEEAMNALIEQSIDCDAITNSSTKTYITKDSQLTPQSKGNKDIDILFRHEGKICYRESKCNLQLDSEKSKVTASKIEDITRKLQVLYPNCEIDAAILNMEWSDKKAFMHGVRIEYAGEFIQRIGFDCSEQEYEAMGKQIGRDFIEGLNG